MATQAPTMRSLDSKVSIPMHSALLIFISSNKVNTQVGFCPPTTLRATSGPPPLNSAASSNLPTRNRPSTALGEASDRPYSSLRVRHLETPRASPSEGERERRRSKVEHRRLFAALHSRRAARLVVSMHHPTSTKVGTGGTHCAMMPRCGGRRLELRASAQATAPTRKRNLSCAVFSVKSFLSFLRDFFIPNLVLDRLGCVPRQGALDATQLLSTACASCTRSPTGGGIVVSAFKGDCRIAELEGLLAAAMTRIAQLEVQVERLTKLLEQTQRTSKRQAAPFSKGGG